MYDVASSSSRLFLSPGDPYHRRLMPKRSDRARRRSSRKTDAPGNALASRPDAAHLARTVPHLSPESLHQLIRHSGLEASGEIVALATPAQLASVFDMDLWRSAQPGHDEQFDAERFAEWLEL